MWHYSFREIGLSDLVHRWDISLMTFIGCLLLFSHAEVAAAKPSDADSWETQKFWAWEYIIRKNWFRERRIFQFSDFPLSMCTRCSTISIVYAAFLEFKNDPSMCFVANSSLIPFLTSKFWIPVAFVTYDYVHDGGNRFRVSIVDVHAMFDRTDCVRQLPWYDDGYPSQILRSVSFNLIPCS